MASFRARIGGIIERLAPLICALATLSFGLYYKEYVQFIFNEYNLSFSQLLAGIFGWASVMTGFMFGVYALVFSKSDGFIAEIKNTSSMKKFLSYIRLSIKVGFTLTITGIPMLVINREPQEAGVLFYFVAVLYVSFFVYSLFSAIRVAYIFGVIVRVPERIRYSP